MRTSPHSRFARLVATTLAFCLVGEVLTPAALLALTGGPQQPEFASFTPVGSSGMVNEFTGGFSYNLPVLNVPGPNGFGYALSLAYHANPSPEEEASWVGYGWTLNPGAITRSKRGFPDDRRSGEVDYLNKTRSNVTLTATKRLGVEVWSQEAANPDPLNSQGHGNDGRGTTLGGASGFITNRYNNYRGYGYTTGFSLQFLGAANIGYAQSDGQGAWSFSISPVALLSTLTSLGSGGKPASAEWSQVPGRLLQRAIMNSVSRAHTISSSTGAYGIWNLSDYSIPTNSPSYSGTTMTFGAAIQGAILPNMGLEGGISGTYTRQSSPEKVTRQTIGYMYSGSASLAKGASEIMDYRMEQDGPYHSRDEYLSIPFALADQYVVSGEGISGGFRVHHRNPGYFRPNHASSTTEFVAFNGDIQLGVDIGWGVGINGGAQKLEVNGAGNGPYSFASGDGDDEPYFFRFVDDLGGSVTQSRSDEPQRAAFSGSDVVVPGNAAVAADLSARTGRAGFIGYSTNKEMQEHPRWGCIDGPNKNVELRSIARSNLQNQSDSNANLSLFVKRTDPAIEDGIGEFAVTKEDGSTYLYGLPVYSRDEANVQIGLFGSNGVHQNFYAYRAAPGPKDDYSYIGQIDRQPYATSYLLTGIIGPDYVDRTNNGLTEDDLGGYVRFNYTRIAGSTEKSASNADWYKWRMPYRGLQYQRNAMSDPMDDVGAVQYGYKEVYYLQSIETKTHIAQFATQARFDGYPAVRNESTAATSATATTVGQPGTPRLQSLSRIDLYKKGVDGARRSLQVTTRFEYERDTLMLCMGLPNADSLDGSGAPTGHAKGGRLTLKRVWFEHEGAVNAKINPYEFGYTYDRSNEYAALLGAGVVAKPEYAAILRENDTLRRSSENPRYDEANIDRWGSYQFNGMERHSVFNPWVSQVRNRRDANGLKVFDPAAWHLKTIRLPSGGEIHVQYEQNEYTHVQHRPAMVMTPLATRSNVSWNADLATRNRYYLALDSVGVSASYLGEVKRQLHKRFVDPEGPRELIYFRFLYVLEASSETLGPQQASLERCNTEYITGYAQVEKVDTAEGKVYIEFKTDQGWTLPERVCDDYARTHGSGIRNLGGSCDASVAGVPDTKMSVGESAEMILKLFFGVLSTHNSAKGCRWLSYKDSYLRIPTPIAKLGGGVRVKRLLMIDPGLENGEAALYGTEYKYVNEDGSSSGVATNEPAIGREENALVELLKKRSPAAKEVFSGEDKEQFEGPIGETLLPGASVGYGRVVATNIHTGRTGTGAVVSEFYTARDYPFDLANASAANVSRLGTDKTGIRGPKKISMGFDAGLVRGDFADLWKTQGFRFVISSMHGQPKSTSTYAEPGSGQNGVPKDAIASVTYDYFQPGELIPVAHGPSISDTVHMFLGKEVEVVTESRQVRDYTVDATGQVDFGIVPLIFPFPFGSAMVSGSVNETVMRQHVTTKVVRYPVIQRSVTVKKDGIATTTENVAFDPTSGKPVLVRTADGFHGLVIQGSPRDGSYYSLSIPATRHYSAMGQKAANYRMRFGGQGSGSQIAKRYADGRHWLSIGETAAGGMQKVLDGLFEGDVVHLTAGSSSLGVYNVGKVGGNRIEILPISYSYSETEFERVGITMTVLKSGRSNQLTTDVGSVTTYRIPPSFAP